MYLRFFGLSTLPFELTPNPRFLFLTDGHREALGTLHYGVSSGKSITVLLGQAGMGKTTLLRTVLESEEYGQVRWVCLNNPILTRKDFLQTLASRFELSAKAGRSKSAFLDELERVLRDRRTRGEISVLVVDEAQSLSGELLEEIRLLANIETTTDKLLLLVLAGQPEFAARLNDPALRPLKQRVTLRCEITPFDMAETAAYIASRIATAGGDSARLFTREAVVAIHECARGVPRTINVICDNALLGAFALGRLPVDRSVVMDVVADFDLSPERPATRETAAPDAPATAERSATASREIFEQISSPRRFAFFGLARR